VTTRKHSCPIRRGLSEPPPSVDTVLIKDAAHELALHYNAPQTNDLINGWAASHA
jgi:hypothetical protein